MSDVSLDRALGTEHHTMRKDKAPGGAMGTLAVLAAAAREAEELLSVELDLEPAAIAEANRRLQLFMRAARQMAR